VPRAVRALRWGSHRTAVEPLEIRHTIDAATVAELTGIMEQVVERGTGTNAQVPGFTVAGKTGTAAKVVNGRYSNTDYFASFVGFVPSRRPALTILVVIDRPQGGEYYGGAVAAPVFKRVAEQALRYLGVAPTVFPAPPVLVAENPFATPAGSMTLVATRTGDSVLDVSSGPPAVPDLRGLSARDAILRLARLGLVARISGDGVVMEQDPVAGTPLDDRGTCVLRLARVTQIPSSAATPQ
jgi:cell division protein FtsI (penicillin-binding protein 3)